MKTYKSLIYCLLFLTISLDLKAQNPRKTITHEPITLAQAYMNLSLTETYSDSLTVSRISKILPFEESELKSITNKKFIRQNHKLYHFSYSLLYLNNAKLLFRNKNEITRNALIEWKNTLGKAQRHYKMTDKNPFFTRMDTSLHDLINFKIEYRGALSRKIEGLRFNFTPYFNNDVYPEFKKLFFKAKRSINYTIFLGLGNNAGIYDLSLEFSILKEMGDKTVKYLKPSGGIIYELDLKLDLISRYIQLKYIASDNFKKALTNSQINELFSSYDNFIRDLKKENDEFILKELNAEVCEVLHKKLNGKYPERRIIAYLLSDNQSENSVNTVSLSSRRSQYFFPNPAPKASADINVENYKDNLTVLGEVDNHISGILNATGYNNQLHYYYDMDGFALATSLEKFNTDGSNIDDDERWITKLGTEGKFSYYEIFKSLFFETESEFRMFVFIVASENATISDVTLSTSMAEQLMQDSYDALPDNLKNKTLINKNLTVLVYHFHQSDIGKVPILNVSDDLNATTHMNLAGLSEVLNRD